MIRRQGALVASNKVINSDRNWGYLISRFRHLLHPRSHTDNASGDYECCENRRGLTLLGHVKVVLIKAKSGCYSRNVCFAEQSVTYLFILFRNDNRLSYLIR